MLGLELGIIGCVAVLILGLFILPIISIGYRRFDTSKSPGQMLFNLLLMPLSPLFLLHLFVFDSIYLGRGKLSKK